MSRARRLLDLVQELRSHRNPVTGAKLAEATGVSLRTLYRDIDALKAQGAPIEGEPGLGYVLMPGFMLPPLMFTEDEIEAIVLGSKWVAMRADENLGEAARSHRGRVDEHNRRARPREHDLRFRADRRAHLVADLDARPAESPEPDLHIQRLASVGHRREILDLLSGDEREHAAVQPGIEHGRRRRGLAGMRQPEGTHARLFEELQHRRVVDVIERVEVAPP